MEQYKIITWTGNSFHFEENRKAESLQEIWAYGNKKYGHKDHVDVYQVCPICKFETHLEEDNVPVCEGCGQILETLSKNKKYTRNHHRISDGFEN